MKWKIFALKFWCNRVGVSYLLSAACGILWVVWVPGHRLLTVQL